MFTEQKLLHHEASPGDVCTRLVLLFRFKHHITPLATSVSNKQRSPLTICRGRRWLQIFKEPAGVVTSAARHQMIDLKSEQINTSQIFIHHLFSQTRDHKRHNEAAPGATFYIHL